MKTTLIFLLLTGYCYAQMLGTLIQTDAEPVEEIIVEPVSPGRMPIVRPNTSFYRLRTDPKNVVRATTDNMLVRIPDSSTYYTMVQSPRLQHKPRPFVHKAIPQPYKYAPRKRP